MYKNKRIPQPSISELNQMQKLLTHNQTLRDLNTQLQQQLDEKTRQLADQMKANTELADQLAQARAQSQSGSSLTDATTELQMLRQKTQDQAKVINALVQNVGPVPESNERMQQTISDQKQCIQTLEA